MLSTARQRCAPDTYDMIHSQSECSINLVAAALGKILRMLLFPAPIAQLEFEFVDSCNATYSTVKLWLHVK